MPGKLDMIGENGMDWQEIMEIAKLIRKFPVVGAVDNWDASSGAGNCLSENENRGNLISMNIFSDVH